MNPPPAIHEVKWPQTDIQKHNFNKQALTKMQWYAYSNSKISPKKTLKHSFSNKFLLAAWFSALRQ